MPKRVPNKKYSPEFKKLVVETMLKGKLGYSETAERFEIRHKTGNESIWKKVRKAWQLSIEAVAVLAGRRSCPRRWKKIC